MKTNTILYTLAESSRFNELGIVSIASNLLIYTTSSFEELTNFPNCQKATALAAATFKESTP